MTELAVRTRGRSAMTESDYNGLVRGLMSVRTSPAVWDLRCDMREKVMTWLQQAYPEALPRMRAELSHRPDGPTPAVQRPPSGREPPKE